MKNYLDLLQDIKDNGNYKEDRTGVGTLSVFGRQLKFDLKNGFPLITTKKVYTNGIVQELLWFLKGDTNIKFLVDNNTHIWDAWATDSGDLGPIYGKQWVDWNGEGINQIETLIKQLKNTPDSRRMLVSAWNVSVLPNESISPQSNVLNGKQALPPCHVMFQFYTSNMKEEDIKKYKAQNPEADFIPTKKISCQLYQRSADVFLGVPFNIASYSLLTHMIAQVCDMWVDEFIITFGDVHIYNNLIEQVNTQLAREPMDLCQLKLNNDIKNIFDFTASDIEFRNYQSHPAIKGVVAV